MSMSKRSEYLKGKSSAYFANLTPAQFSEIRKKGNEYKLSAALTRMVSTVNKRLKAFAKIDKKTPATRYINKKYGEKISTRGLDVNEKIRLYYDMREFLNAKTGTIEGYNDVMERTIKALSEENLEISEYEYDDFWDAFNKIEDIYKKDNDGATFDRELRYRIYDVIKEKQVNGLSPQSVAYAITRKRKLKDEVVPKSVIDRIYEKAEKERKVREDQLSTARVLAVRKRR